jgi:hypothetical protein
MKLIIESAAANCVCGHPLPTSILLKPAPPLQMILGMAAKQGLAKFVEAVLVTCPKCKVETKYGEAKIVA